MTSRRSALKALAATATMGLTSQAAEGGAEKGVVRGRIKQSVVPWCFNPMPVPDLARHAARLGLKSVELTDPSHWPLLKELGLTCAIAGSNGFSKGFAHREEWDECLAALRPRIDECAAAGIERVITFSGFRRELPDEEGMANMVAGLKQIAPWAEKKKVVVCLEMLNSRVDEKMKGHPDYFCDSMESCVEICRQVGSAYVRILFDLYHVQIMHGDVISRVHQYKDYIAHVHTAGVPGRGEIDETQELNYPALMRALLNIGYEGFVGQEFIPTREKASSLAQGARICDV